MLHVQALRFEPQVLVDHLSTEGPRVTGVRGMLLQSRIKQLKDAGHFDDYLPRLPEEYRDPLLQALASSWVPVQAAAAHYAAVDDLQLSATQLSRLGEPVGASMFESLFATLLRTARSAGVDKAMWAGLNQAERVWNRMYNGGGCKVVRVGPKDATVEIRGLSYASSRSFRLLHAGFLRGGIALTAKACVVKPLASHDPRSGRLTVSMSWV